MPSIFRRFAREPQALVRCRPLRWLLFAKSGCYRVVVNAVATVRLCRVIRRFRPDIVHTNVSQIGVGARAAAIMGVPHVWHLREYIDTGIGLRPFPSLAALKRRLQGANNHAIAITDGVYAYYGLGGGAVRIYDGVFHDGPTVRKAKKDYWLCVGAINDFKGSFELLRAYRDYVALGGKTQLWFAGEGREAYVHEMREYIRGQGLGGMVRLLGFRTDAQELMAEAKALFVPNHAEGFGFITAEAMRRHCLVVGRDEAGTKEQFDNGLRLCGEEIGIRFRDNAELPGIMAEIDGADFSEMTERAYAAVMELYTTEKCAAAVCAYYRSVMKGGSGRLA